MKRLQTMLTVAALLPPALSGASRAASKPDGSQEPGPLAALEAINGRYEQQLRDLECRRIADLAALAEKSSADVTGTVYRQLFGLAIARGLCSESHAAAEHCLRTMPSDRDLRALASLVRILAHAELSEHDRSLAEWKALFQASSGGGSTAGQADSERALAVGEAFLQRLVHEGRYDVARKLCEAGCAEGAPAVIKDHFEDRLARLALVGKPAPAIASDDVDGHPVSLADHKGKVVLVDFWATWCPPCIESIPVLHSLVQKYGQRGFAILRVNVDALHEDVKETKAALPFVRRLLVKHRIAWPNLQSGQPTGDVAQAYGVEQIPANFLIGRDGTVIAIEQSGEALERAIVKALDAGR
jgi:thiol-disulfide isomerase/thioredoxin